MLRRDFLRWAAGVAAAAAAFPGGGAFHIVHLPIRSYRLLAMGMDEDGDIWFGSIHHRIHRYTPPTGAVETIALPPTKERFWVSASLPANRKVYLLGQKYPRLLIYNRAGKKFSEASYPSRSPDVWYGLAHPGRRHLYLFDRGAAGVIKWDAQAEGGRAIPFPYDAPLPSFGLYDPRGDALWCGIWDYTGGQYRPVAITRFDLKTDSFTGIWHFPNNDAGLRHFGDPNTTLFFPWTLKGKLRPFDTAEKRWCRFLEVPGFGRDYGFIGLFTAHGGRLYYSLSTYNGDERIGCDGKPYHFLNALLEFDPQSGKFDFLRLDVPGAYYQVAYTLSARGEFYATGSNIMQEDGTLYREREGEVVVWQSHAPSAKSG